MSEKKELSNEELDKVTGGYGGDAFGEYGFSGYVDRYAVQVGQTYYFVEDGSSGKWAKVAVDWTGEVGSGRTVRTHKGTVSEHSLSFGASYGSYVSIEAGPYSAYKNLDKSKLPVRMEE